MGNTAHNVDSEQAAKAGLFEWKVVVLALLLPTRIIWFEQVGGAQCVHFVFKTSWYGGVLRFMGKCASN
eukprot:m.17624 g.17624  ORF g.17624 m.17624 type:complete len:69 (+) comp7515_c0_seq1:1806-2012(+)